MAVVKDFMNGECRMIVHDEGICPKEEEEIIVKVSGIIAGEEYRRYLEEQKNRDNDIPALKTSDVSAGM